MFNKEKPVEVRIDREKCTKCGLCIEFCSSYLIKGEDGFPCAQSVDKTLFGCIQCGHCMMICPNNAIEILGEDIDASHLRETGKSADFDSLNSLLLKRRSIRKYKKDEVPSDIIEKIINAAATSAVSIPPSEVKVLVFSGKEKMSELKEDVIEALRSFTKMSNPFALTLLRLFAGKTTYRMFKEFIIPLCKETIAKHNEGIDYLFYEAPAAMIFYGTELTDKEDTILAASTATTAAESLGLGTCFIGTLGAVFQMNKKLRQKYNIKNGEKIGTAFVLGYPDVKFNKGFQRKFKEVRIIS